MTKMMHIGQLMSGTGSHVGGWRMPDAQFGSENLGLIRHMVDLAEKAKLDFVFFADGLNTGLDAHAGFMLRFEPLSLLGALAVTTSHIGLVATVSTSFSQPYNLARALSTIDHMSNGRVGWNVVTTSSEDAAANFGSEGLPPSGKRYDMAEEYVEVAKGLWDSWEDGVLIGDKASGQYVDSGKLHVLHHQGENYSVRGPLNISRAPQGYPVIFQAGASDRGIAFAGATAEVIFTAQQIPEEALAYGDKVRAAAVAAGRSPDAIKIMCGVCPIVAESKEEAQKIVAELGALINPVSAMRVLSDRMGYDMNQYPLDEPVPDLPPSGAGTQGHAKQLFSIARREKMTLRQLRDYAAASSGHRLVLGSPVEIADDFEAWFKSGATDGFAIMSPYLPAPFEKFTSQVIPILVERGLFRAEYEGVTLRDHLGLARPDHPAVLKKTVAAA
ncbi:LLM class flavin-dependent oxidoreductase [Sphingobium sp. H39-3-25]|uniref:LLM class flavin-dependent oxidoreductase n=1 Tax=Sphingobium arseniciresistens TaxID=3030834 RepID=UPI0023BA358D|nr:LLM class flavin-dependent oxidoreductase [Sphingobium arseniciresistens]